MRAMQFAFSAQSLRAKQFSPSARDAIRNPRAPVATAARRPEFAAMRASGRKTRNLIPIRNCIFPLSFKEAFS